MPIYEYQCEKCGAQFEEMQKISDPPLEQCPECDGKLTKLVSKSSFQLKGGGWYVTDYKKDSSKEKTDASKEKTDSSSIEKADKNKKKDE